MLRVLRTLAVVLLFFNSVSAIFGGIGLIMDPMGEKLGMPVSFLDHSPFDSFLVPGIILLVMNGLLSLMFAFLVIRRAGCYPWLVILQGCILLGWLSVQILMIREYAWVLHTLYYGVGLGLIITGILLVIAWRKPG